MRMPGKARLSEHAIGIGAIGLGGRSIEAQHTIVDRVSHPQPAGGVHNDPLRLVHATRSACNCAVGKIRLAEDSIGRGTVGLGGGTIEAQHAVVPGTATEAGRRR